MRTKAAIQRHMGLVSDLLSAFAARYYYLHCVNMADEDDPLDGNILGTACNVQQHVKEVV